MRFTKQDWIIKGLQVLGDEGYHAIVIDYLCEKFKITKGSFYHHFESIEEYQTLMVKLWEKETLQRLTEVMDGAVTPETKINRMIDFAFTFSGKLELSLRAWALHNKLVKNLLVKMEVKRIGLVTEMYTEIGLSRKASRELAELAHAAWIGIQTCYIEGVIDQERSIQLINEMMKMMVKSRIGQSV